MSDSYKAEDIDRAIAEFRHAATEYAKAPSAGTRYALNMAAAECQLLGIDLSTIAPEAGDE